MARRPVLLGTAVAALLLLLAAPTPGQALGQLRDAGSARDPFAPLVAALSLVAWALALWIAVTALLTVAGRLPGLAGRVAGAVSRRIAPAAVRRAVEVALGLTVAVGVLGATPASAATAPGTATGTGTAAAASLDWAAPPAAPAPGAAAPASLDWAASTTPAPQDLDWPGAAAGEAPAPESVVVRPGDTLWSLAEQSLRAVGRAGDRPRGRRRLAGLVVGQPRGRRRRPRPAPAGHPPSPARARQPAPGPRHRRARPVLSHPS